MKTALGLTFEEATHAYAFGGRPIPSVTQVLSDVGIIRQEWFSESAAARGTYLHSCIEAFEEGDLDEEIVPAEYRGYLDSFKRGRELLRIDRVVGVEVRAVNTLEWYGGTVDLLAFDEDGDGLVVDWKSGAPSKWHRMQTAAYSLLDFDWYGTQEPKDDPDVRRASLYLDKDGGLPRFDFHTEGQIDRMNWRAALRVYNLKRA